MQFGEPLPQLLRRMQPLPHAQRLADRLRPAYVQVDLSVPGRATDARTASWIETAQEVGASVMALGVDTQADLDMWANVMARSIFAAGGRPETAAKGAYKIVGLRRGGCGFVHFYEQLNRHCCGIGSQSYSSLPLAGRGGLSR